MATKANSEHCECPGRSDDDQNGARCDAHVTTADRSRWLCTRPDGHDGPHSACVPGGEHPVHVWEAEG